ncbi:MAG: hypothetical protein COV74_08075 [Candidatus Omnitrophica bacterium CG11_big_fil_rev_8_21_14_0_20_45_26]|uniref:Glycosyl transferase n=1 Tax=Candidatus Abzuiibacterium crystallinum TaxID=1974748 RepID=A0A2H0LQ75_9BACT|nr:MAG: hypothetical protein COV74_08075 [Candidatus Omnitrophica bacterium CG11_big_fil_rev_8_21_14_0_20_45_26]PIW65176.1 MAG: hypothetical protein COW12_03115 [Candidatus Omnitrophica bacterium CG12_big_fil_rev_8_21_14_0_65_45_16]
MKILPDAINRILVISLTNLGDVILTTPVMAQLHAAYPHAAITVLIGPKGRELIAGSGTVREVIVYDKKANWQDKITLIRQLRQKHFDLVIDLRNTLIPFLIQAKRFNFPVFGRQPVAMRARHLSRLDFLELPQTKETFEFFNEQDAETCWRKMKGLNVDRHYGVVVLAPGAGSFEKRWPAASFGKVGRYFTAQQKQVVVVGSLAEKELGKQIQEFDPFQIANACGALTLRELAAFLKEADCVVSNDSAIMHLANEQNVSTVALFGPTNPNQYAAYKSGNRVIQAESNLREISGISPERVIKACEDILNANVH